MRIWHLISLILLSSCVTAQDCNNPLIDVFGFTDTFSTPKSQSFNYCKSLKGKSVCCSKKIINKFQKMTDTLVSRLKEMVKERDLYLMNTLEELVPQYLSLNKKFNDTIGAAFTKVQATNPSEYLKLLSLVNLVAPKALKFELMRNTFSTILTSFQKARVTCVTRMIRIQAAAWCLACDPNYSTQQGVGATGSVVLASKICNRIKRGCYDYMEYSNELSLILEANTLLSIYTELVDNLEDIANTGTVPDIDLTSSFSITGDKERPTYIPSTCPEDTYCDWFCTNLLNTNNATINESLVGNGGAPFASDNLYQSEFYSRLLLENNSTGEPDPEDTRFLDENREMRMLSTLTWTTADDDEAGVTVDFPQDPAGVSASDGDKFFVSLIMLLIFFVSISL